MNTTTTTTKGNTAMNTTKPTTKPTTTDAHVNMLATLGIEMPADSVQREHARINQNIEREIELAERQADNTRRQLFHLRSNAQRVDARRSPRPASGDAAIVAENERQGFDACVGRWLRCAQEVRDSNARRVAASPLAGAEQGFAGPDARPTPLLSVERGRRYLRIVSTVRTAAGELTDQRSAFAFVDTKTGNVLKPASWRGPAKHARGNVFAVDGGISCVGAYGIAHCR
jgi:hypothetical protein